MNFDDNQTFSSETLFRSAELSGVSSDVAEQALANITSGSVVGLAVSGKLASGKDTVAPAALSRLAVPSIEHLFFARPLKDEFSEILAVCRSAGSAAAASSLLIDFLELPAEAADRLVEMLYEFANNNPELDAYSRTPEIRLGLQYLGTDVRRSQDTDWWVKRATAEAITALANQRSIYYTDLRFPNEVAGAASIGCYVVRIDVTPETQAARLMGRDGLTVDPAAGQHPSETVLDDFEGFHLRVSNDDLIEEPVAAILAGITEHRQNLTK